MMYRKAKVSTALLSALLAGACGSAEGGPDEVPPIDGAPVVVVQPVTVATVELPNGNTWEISSVEEDGEVMAREFGSAPLLIDVDTEKSILEIYLDVVAETEAVPAALAALEPDEGRLTGRSVVPRIQQRLRTSEAYAARAASELAVAKSDQCVQANFEAAACTSTGSNTFCDSGQWTSVRRQSTEKKWKSNGRTAACSAPGVQEHYYWEGVTGNWKQWGGSLTIPTNSFGGWILNGASKRYRRLDHYTTGNGYVRAWSQFRN